jgi:CMP-N,N'-diacetyllegionaminic acid synthase
MTDPFDILGVVPARGGSKGIPRKNLVNLAGRPLLAYTIEAALGARLVSRLIVSTEDSEIARVAAELGAAVPFLRPADLASDTAHSLAVVQHAIETMERLDEKTYDAVVMLQPTTPLRTSDDIDAGIQLLIDSGADSVVSVVDVGANHPYRMKRILEDGRLVNFVDQGFEDMRPRQELPPVYIRSGDLYAARRHVVMDLGTMVGPNSRALIIPSERAVNIDTRFDLERAEELLAGRA